MHLDKVSQPILIFNDCFFNEELSNAATSHAWKGQR